MLLYLATGLHKLFKCLNMNQKTSNIQYANYIHNLLVLLSYGYHMAPPGRQWENVSEGPCRPCPRCG